MPQTTPTRESRVRKSLLNARVNLIFYILTLFVSFFSRKVFLDCLGTDFIGLTSTLQNLLSFLNLAELGIGTSIGYLLYKPLFDSDHQKINEIISVMGYLYTWIGRVILAGGCIMACFLPLIFPSTGFDLLLIYFAFFSFLASSLIGYFINYRQNLLAADQRNYVVTGYYQTVTIIKTILQMALVYYIQSYYLWVAIELTFGILYSFILNWRIDKTYPWLRSEVKQGRQLFKKYPEVMKYTKQVFVHQLCGMVQFQTIPLLTYTFVNLHLVALFGNYTLVMDKLTTMMNQVLGSTSAGVGNLIAEGNVAKQKAVFWQITTIRCWVAGIVCISFFYVITPFIILWLDRGYLLSDTIVFLQVFCVFTQLTNDTSGEFIYGHGLFKDVWSSYAQVILFLVAAVTGGYFLGLTGILIAKIISIGVIRGIWKPYFLFTEGFRTSVLEYWRTFIYKVILLLTPVTIVVSSHWFIFGCIHSENIFASIAVSVSYVVVSTLVFYAIDKDFRNIMTKVLSVLMRKTENFNHSDSGSQQ